MIANIERLSSLNQLQDETSNLRILVIAQFNALGGTATYLSLLLKLLIELNAQVFLVADTNDEANCADIQTTFPGIKIHWLFERPNSEPEGFPKCLLTTASYLKPVLWGKQYDLVIASVGTPERWVEILFLPIPVLYIVHTYPQWGKRPRRLSRVFWSLIKRQLGHHKRLITVSKYSRQIIKKKWFQDEIADELIQVIYNPSPYIMEKDFFPDRKPEQSKVFTILTVGHLENHKNPNFWIDVALTTKALAPEIELEFVWVGGGSLLERYQEYLEPYPWIQLVGDCKNPREYYERADLYLQPSLVESQGIAVLEAAAYGLPAIVSNRGGLPECVTDHETGYILPLVTPWVFAEAIVKMMHEPRLVLELGQKAQKLVEQRFGQEGWVMQMKEVIDDLSSKN